MQKLMRTIDKIESFLSMFLLVFIVLIVFTTSLLRYFGHPINGAETVAATLFVWLIYIAADQVLRKDRHLGVDYFTQRMSPKMQTYVAILAHLIVFAFLAIITISGVVLAISNGGRIMGDLPISYVYVILSVPVGTSLMLLTTIFKIWTHIQKLKGLQQQ